VRFGDGCDEVGGGAEKDASSSVSGEGTVTATTKRSVGTGNGLKLIIHKSIGSGDGVGVGAPPSVRVDGGGRSGKTGGASMPVGSEGTVPATTKRLVGIGNSLKTIVRRSSGSGDGDALSVKVGGGAPSGKTGRVSVPVGSEGTVPVGRVGG
jgi:hypothetical protein